LKDTAAELRAHKIAGDVIENINLDSALPALSMSFSQRTALRQSLLALRAKMGKAATDSVISLLKKKEDDEI
jgi:hypothetical protein